MGSRTQAVIHECPNGETRGESNPFTLYGEPTQGTETSKYLEEEKSNEIPQVAASERGKAQTEPFRGLGVEGFVWGLSRTIVEWGVETNWNVLPERVRAP